MDNNWWQEEIIDRYKNPKHRGKVEGVEAGVANMLCGDKITITARLEKGIIKEAKFEGGGCSISMAAMDMLLDKVIGKKLSQVQKMSGEEIEKMLGVELTLARKKCAYLGLEVLKKLK
ncbi:MAG: iron-sulfur cluster assembly scaffold protein [Candidatus Shapirobacteria bacterium]